MFDTTSPKDWKMEYTSLGGTGLQVSRINYFDNAEAYGNPRGNCEILFGEALKQLQKTDPYLYRRTDLVITTKFFWAPSGHPQSIQRRFDYSYNGINEYGTSRKHIMESIDKSLKRLQLDYIDVVYAHRFDALTPVLEVVRAFTDVVKSGKAHYWGTSMWPSWRIIQAFHLAQQYNLIPPIVEQPKYNLFDRHYVEDHYLPVFDHPYNIGTTIWGALDGGILSGKYNSGEVPKGSRLDKASRLTFFDPNIPKHKLEKLQKLQLIAQRLETTVSVLSIAWCLKNKHVSVVLLGATKASQLETFAAIKVQDKLTPSIMQEIEEIIQNKPKLDTNLYGPFFRIPNARL
ncbi:oxidoreductase, aldo/keto reductase family protein [Reticulomyxa filosa]|uniref:Oxidoreductase, aldo/keto reductase family protein n=1 Tax=Reticulomyxa filosa TaxID=46433 RepID=X6LHZ2_RETFI|nr:oxidoreductase, aldo/keto reductase family protein [Reticulomyxa filosa]|eukprot:ETO01578.1 oxidoreductase, aldo/keto reductase family protein [Reticulomyxa filosa]